MLTLSEQSKSQQNMGAGYAFLPIKQVDLLTLKVVSESRMTWATSVPILVFLEVDWSVVCLLAAYCGPIVR